MSHMNNLEVEKMLIDCQVDLEQTNTIIAGLGLGSLIVPYLTKFAIIRACGTIEVVFKTIIADFCDKRSKKQVKFFISKKVRENSCNPSYDKICQVLSDFDEKWKEDFKTGMKKNVDYLILKTSLQSLVDARNDFAHGGNPSSSIKDVIRYFSDSRTVVEILDSVVL